MNSSYRVIYTSVHWVGKADPSGFGENNLYSNDYAWLQEQTAKLASRGARVKAIEKYDESRKRYVQI
jgi:hypothetical protein